MLEIADIIGIIAFSVSGFIIGVKNRLDMLGIILSAFFTALGGGIIRDLLTHRNIFAFNNSFAGSMVLIVVIIGIYLKFHQKNIENKTIFILSDAIGLSSFSISGALAAINAGFNIFGVVFLALITAVGGGMIRDIMINEVPFILKEKFYGSVSIIIGFIIYFFNYNFLIPFIFIFGIILRIFAYVYDWHLPKI
ncbi:MULTISPECIES: trimeric intracellular cation channel family protein [unclassified Lebetimonas]|uniref:trimeric intracellular cation channel family protein n=1 Tax=unclassified Lebetimonas TaxID=2648158 RepID=UPI0004675D90|nr:MULTISPECIES: TRIC cation channel family protein [unclassified Lebetimonas]